METAELIFRNIVEASPYPVYLCTGEDMVISVANAATLKAWAKDRSVIGKRFLEALPELEGQPFIGLLQNVYRTGETYYAKNDRADLLVDGRLQTYYFDFTYQAIRNSSGVITGVAGYATDVTELERARQAVEESQQVLHNMVRQAPVGICIIKGNPFYTEVVNDHFLTLSRKKRSDFDGKPYWSSLPEIAPVYEAITRSVIETRQAYHAKGHKMSLVRNGVKESIYADFVYEPIQNADGTCDTIIIVATEVTAQVLAQKELQLLNGKLSDTNEEYAVINEELTATNEELIHTQQSLQKLNNELEARVMARTAELAQTNKELAFINKTLYNTNEELQQTQQELQNLNFELEERIISRTNALLESENNLKNVNEELATANEEMATANEALMTANEELFLAKENMAALIIELAASESKFRSLIEQAPVAISVFKTQELIIDSANTKMLELWGKTEEVNGKTFIEALPEMNSQPFPDILRNVMASGIPYHKNESKAAIITNGILQERYFDFIYQPIKDENDQVNSVLQIVTEVTGQIKARNELQQVAKMMNLAITAARLGSWHIDTATKQLHYNDNVAKIFGYEGETPMSYEQAINQVSAEYQPKIVTEIEKAIAGGGDYDFTYSQHRFNDGKLIWLRSIGKVSEDEQGNYSLFAGFVMDITSQVNAGKAIEESEARFRGMAEGTDVLIAVEDEISNSTYFNKAWSDFTGRPLNKLIEHGWTDLVHPEDKERYVHQYSSALKLLEPFTEEFRLLTKEHEYRWLLAKGHPRFHTDGSFAGYISSCVDITEQKQNEQRKNDFIGIVSHELKTPLTSLSAYVQMLHGKAVKLNDGFTVSALEKANKQVKKMTTLINGFLNVSRLEAGKIQIDKQRFDMANLIKETEAEIETTISSHQIIFAPVKSTLVMADRDKIGQVINNFISNAVKYSPAGSKIEVACMQTDGQIKVSVKDEGMGVSATDEKHLFDRYYRAEGSHMQTISGFGIGLYLCAEIVKRHEGSIWVKSEVGAGSTFYFSLPLTQTAG
ncbi:MAG: PAS domain S-box protein [Sphingobacteriaceae bacterium]|nr:MAG: PAS domain S-box protein [Sphingobacteriaceae bacterium]